MPENPKARPQRRLRRFFSDTPIPREGHHLNLSFTETRHLRQVIRLEAGDRCLIVDREGRQAEAVIAGFPASGITDLIVEKILPEVVAVRMFLRLCVAVPKGKMDGIVEKIQELGADELQPLETERTLIKMAGEGSQRAVARWQKIAQEAAKQSGNVRMLQIAKPLSFEKALSAIPDGENIAVFHPFEAVPFPVWASKLDQTQKTHLFFGPEGGFNEKEIRLAREKKACVVSLGESILKVETAVAGVLAALRFSE